MPYPVPRSWRGVVNLYRGRPAEVKDYYEALPSLIEKYDWDVSLGFMFIRVEKGLNNMLYCGARKLHRAHSEVARRFVDKHHMTRKEFRKLFKNVFGEHVPAPLTALIQEAEDVRDKAVHGKNITDADHRKAIVRVLEYSENMNDLVQRLAQFKPFTTNLRGFAGRGDALDERTTSWLMKGLGFMAKAPDDAAR
jgi:hypothetical protein